MKKTTIVLITLGVISFASCKKDRTCECTTTYSSSSNPTTDTETETIVYKKIKKSHAKDACYSYNSDYSSSSGSSSYSSNYKTDCKLKK